MHVYEFQDMMRQIYFHHDSKRGAKGTYLWLVEEVEELGEAIKGRDKKALEEGFRRRVCRRSRMAGVTSKRGRHKLRRGSYGEVQSKMSKMPEHAVPMHQKFTALRLTFK